jgi:hypothetical protein
MNERKALPSAVATIYQATTELNTEFPLRSFTPDGHLVGHLGEVIAAREFGLELLPNSHPGHDAVDSRGRCVQIKLTARDSISMYADCDRLIVMKIESAQWAELIYDGDGAPIWAIAGKLQKNGQRRVGLAAIRRVRDQRSGQ